MNNDLYPLNTKVKIPHTKQGWPISEVYSAILERIKGTTQDWLYYAGEKNGVHMLNNEPVTREDPSGDYFAEADIEPYDTPKKQNRTLKRADIATAIRRAAKVGEDYKTEQYTQKEYDEVIDNIIKELLG